MNKTTIPWTERTWNPVHGCTKESEGCRHCYAEAMAKRLQGMGVRTYENGFHVTLNPSALDEPKKIKKPSMFFVCSMGDLFHKDVPFEYIDLVMETIEATPQHTYQILTKRDVRMAQYFLAHRRGNVPHNVWLGVSVEGCSQVARITHLVSIRNATVRFLSCEPLLEDIDLDIAFYGLNGIDWVICGGESGNQARPMHKEWALNLKRQCDEQDIPFFFKQWGTYGEDGVKRNVKANGHLIDGKEYMAWPKTYQQTVPSASPEGLKTSQQ